MKIEDNKILVEQKTGGTPKSGKQGGTPKSGKQGGTNKGGTGNTGGSSGGGNIPAPAPTSTAIPTPSPTPVPEPAPKQTEPVKREQPIEIPQPKKDINFCKCWTIGNLFKEFPDEQKNSKAEDFYTWVSINYNGTFKRTENLVNDKNCGDSNCLFYQSPVIRELSLSQVSTSSLTVAKNLFMVWKETLTPKSVEPKPETQTVAKSPSIGYLTFDDEDAFKTAASQENLYAKNKNGFRTNLDDFINLYKTSTYAESTKRGECRDTARLYISLVNNMIEDSFGDPNSSDLEDYKVRSKYWYGFLTLLMTIKSRAFEYSQN
jgi:hypothetical protein